MQYLHAVLCTKREKTKPSNIYYRKKSAHVYALHVCSSTFIIRAQLLLLVLIVIKTLKSWIIFMFSFSKSTNRTQKCFSSPINTYYSVQWAGEILSRVYLYRKRTCNILLLVRTSGMGRLNTVFRRF